jgi:crotonobetainyl-CoA:carnitine CoA-transferase CaiB-like acyl-CoA transferase
MSGENCLAGMKVLDLTQFEAGPSCTEALAWLGADVVKIENPGAGDPGRSIGRTSPQADALYFLQYNSNKRSAAINLKDPGGLELVKRLARCADVMIENFAPGAIDRLGLGYAAIKAINPAIIYCQVKGFGTGSPFEKNLAFDMIAQAAGGLMSVTGDEDGQPCKAGATVGDTGTGMVMAISVLAAYVRRLRTGEGEHLQVGMQDSVMHYIRNAFTHMDRSGGKAAPRAGSRTVGGGQPPIGVYPCKGGGPNNYVYIYAGGASPEHWNRLIKVMGRDDLIGDPRYSTAAARAERRAEVDEFMSNWTRQLDKHTVMRMVGAASVPAGAVLDTRELADDPTFAQRKIRQTMAHPVIGDYAMSGWPVRFGDAPPAVDPAPLLGQHSGNVLADWLKMDDVAIGTLRDAKVIAGDVAATPIAAK